MILDPIQTYIFIGFAIGLFIMAACFVFITREWLKLKHDHQMLRDFLSRHNNDIAGLCSAAVNIDERMDNHDKRVNYLAERLDNFEGEGFTNQSYHSAIQKVKDGTTVNKLIGECGLARDEAELLIRLHSGQKKELNQMGDQVISV